MAYGFSFPLLLCRMETRLSALCSTIRLVCDTLECYVPMSHACLLQDHGLHMTGWLSDAYGNAAVFWYITYCVRNKFSGTNECPNLLAFAGGWEKEILWPKYACDPQCTVAVICGGKTFADALYVPWISRRITFPLQWLAHNHQAGPFFLLPFLQVFSNKCAVYILCSSYAVIMKYLTLLFCQDHDIYLLGRPAFFNFSLSQSIKR